MTRNYTYCIFLIFTLFFLGCNDTKEVEALFEGYSLKPINFLNKKAYIPNEFLKTNLNELGEMLRQNPDLNEFDKMNYQLAVSSSKASGKVPVLYQDTVTTGNSIWFLPGSYVPLNKNQVNEFVQATEYSFINPARSRGIIIDRLEAKFITKNNLKAIKIKYEIKLGVVKYLTQYIVTKNLETYSIMVVNNKNEDYQKILKSL